MSTYIFNLTENQIISFYPKIDEVCKEFWRQIAPLTNGQNPSEHLNTFVNDFCFTVKINISSLNYLKRT